MPDVQLSDEDSLDLYRFLLERLDRNGFLDVRRQVEAAATAPILERPDPYAEPKLLREFKSLTENQQLRQKTPFEAFAAAIDVLWTRLVEFPRVVTALRENLGGPNQPVEFRVDHDEQYAPTQSKPVSLDRLSLTKAEQAALADAFKAIGILPERNKVQ